MLVYLDETYKQRLREGLLSSKKELDHCIIEGAVMRVRPKIMTVTTTIMALIPFMIGTVGETGSEVMKRIASPMVGGLVSSTFLTLLIIPAIYRIWKGFELRRTLRSTAADTPPPALADETNQGGE